MSEPGGRDINERYRPYVRFLGIVALVDLLLFVVVGVGARSRGWSTLYQYCDGAVLGGMIVASVGTIGLLQDRNPTRRPTHPYADQRTGAHGLEQSRQRRKDDAVGIRFSLHLLVAGLLAAIPAALIQATLMR